MAAAGDGFRVCIRLRPFNKRELRDGAKRIIELNGQQCSIRDPEVGRFQSFNFDFCFQSHDPHQPQFADQAYVFQKIGASLLDNAFTGYHSTLFAYGQTGSGKSFTVVGSPSDPGLIPQACEEIFRRVREPPGGVTWTAEYKVEVSMIEIYNERVRDLLNPNPKVHSSQGLKVRDHPTTGPYVEGLSKLAVSSEHDIMLLMQNGNAMRTIAATNMNRTSSRAHTVLQISITQLRNEPGSGVNTEIVSNVNLVDLAGSERLGRTGAQAGDTRFQEGININQSLSTLGACIKALSDSSRGGGKKKSYVPYRDSILTQLLRDALGGNSKTTMIAALSPADIDYHETLSTLKYAHRAKDIKNDAKINKDPNSNLVARLQDEIATLRAQMRDVAAGPQATGRALTPRSAAAEQEKDEEAERTRSEVDRLRSMLEESQNALNEKRKAEASWEEKLAASQQAQMEQERVLLAHGCAVGGGRSRPASAARARPGAAAPQPAAPGLVGPDPSLPHLVNLNEDPAMSGSLVYFLNGGATSFGAVAASESTCHWHVQLRGLSIASQHCRIMHVKEKGAVTLQAMEGQCYVNGQLSGEPRRLQHGDRVILGHHHVFSFNHPRAARAGAAGVEAGQGTAPGDLPAAPGRGAATSDATSDAAAPGDWHFAVRELAAAKGQIETMQATLGAQGGALAASAAARAVEAEEVRRMEARLREQAEVAERREREKEAALQALIREKEEIAARMARMQAEKNDAERREAEARRAAEDAAHRNKVQVSELERRGAEARRAAEEAGRQSEAAVERAQQEAARLGEEARQTREKLQRLEDAERAEAAARQAREQEQRQTQERLIALERENEGIRSSASVSEGERAAAAAEAAALRARLEELGRENAAHRARGAEAQRMRDGLAALERESEANRARATEASALAMAVIHDVQTVAPGGALQGGNLPVPPELGALRDRNAQMQRRQRELEADVDEERDRARRDRMRMEADLARQMDRLHAAEADGARAAGAARAEAEAARAAEAARVASMEAALRARDQEARRALEEKEHAVQALLRERGEVQSHLVRLEAENEASKERATEASALALAMISEMQSAGGAEDDEEMKALLKAATAAAASPQKELVKEVEVVREVKVVDERQVAALKLQRETMRRRQQQLEAAAEDERKRRAFDRAALQAQISSQREALRAAEAAAAEAAAAARAGAAEAAEAARAEAAAASAAEAARLVKESEGALAVQAEHAAKQQRERDFALQAVLREKAQLQAELEAAVSELEGDVALQKSRANEASALAMAVMGEIEAMGESMGELAGDDPEMRALEALKERAIEAEVAAERQAMRAERAALEGELARLRSTQHVPPAASPAAALEQELLSVLPMVEEANLMSEALQCQAVFEVKLTRGGKGAAAGSARIDILVRYVDRGFSVLWGGGKFQNRMYNMREHYSMVVEDPAGYIIPKEADPFFDATDELQQIGTGAMYLAPLAHLLPVQESTPLLDFRGGHVGMLQAEILPVGPEGEALPGRRLPRPEDLLGRPLNVVVRIRGCRGLPKGLCRATSVSFRWPLGAGGGEEYTTGPCARDTPNPDFGVPPQHFEARVSIGAVTAEHLSALGEGAVTFEVWGLPALDRPETALTSTEGRLLPPAQAPPLMPAAAGGGGGEPAREPHAARGSHGAARSSGAEHHKERNAWNEERLALEAEIAEMRLQLEEETGRREAAEGLLRRLPRGTFEGEGKNEALDEALAKAGMELAVATGAIKSEYEAILAGLEAKQDAAANRLELQYEARVAAAEARAAELAERAESARAALAARALEVEGTLRALQRAEGEMVTQLMALQNAARHRGAPADDDPLPAPRGRKPGPLAPLPGTSAAGGGAEPLGPVLGAGIRTPRGELPALQSRLDAQEAEISHLRSILAKQKRQLAGQQRAPQEGGGAAGGGQRRLVPAAADEPGAGEAGKKSKTCAVM